MQRIIFKTESLELKTNNYHIEDVIEMPETVFQNDSIVNNFYENFKFVTTTSCRYEGPMEREVTYVSATWNFVILFIVLIFMVLNKFMSQQHFSSVISMPFQNGGDRTMRENPSLFNIASFSTIISFILLLSLFVQKIFIVYGGNRILHDNLDFFIDIATCVAAVFVFNYLAMSFYSWLFKTDALIHLHFAFHTSAMASGNLIFIPIILLLFFHPYKIFLILTLVILGLFFFATLIKLLIEVRMLSKINFVNIFLYLCTIEILPILVISKMIAIVL